MNGSAASDLDPRTAEPDFDDWRRGGICGSDAPKVAGVSRWGDALDVYISKVGLVARPQQEPTGPQLRGHALEDVAAIEFERESGRTVARVARRAHPQRQWQRVHLDRRVLAKEGASTSALEIKNTTRMKMKRIIEDNACPADFVAQLAHGCDVFDYRIGYVFVLCSETWERKLFRFDFSATDTLVNLRSLEDLLWNHHVAKRVPPMDWRTIAKPDIEKGEPTKLSDVTTLEGDLGQQFAERMIALREAAALCEEAELLHGVAKGAIEEFMATNNFTAAEMELLVEGVPRIARYRFNPTTGRRSLDQKAILDFVRAHHPQIDVEGFYRTGAPGIYSRAFWLRSKIDEKSA